MFILHVDKKFFYFALKSRHEGLIPTIHALQMYLYVYTVKSCGLPCYALNKLTGKLISCLIYKNQVSGTISFSFHKIGHPSPRIKYVWQGRKWLMDTGQSSLIQTISMHLSVYQLIEIGRGDWVRGVEFCSCVKVWVQGYSLRTLVNHCFNRWSRRLEWFPWSASYPAELGGGGGRWYCAGFM
jgi:hypothetical protein